MTPPGQVGSRLGAPARLVTAFDAPGPYLTVHTPPADRAEHPATSVAARRGELLARGSTDRCVDAVIARLGLPAEDDLGFRAVIAASDGSTIVDGAPEGPERLHFRVDELPWCGPLLEWDQWRVPHIAVAVGDDGCEIVRFVPGEEPAIVPSATDPVDVAEHCRRLAIDDGLRLIVVGGSADRSADIATRLAGMVPPGCHVRAVDAVDLATADAFAEATVRAVADLVARDTVAALQDFRFLEAGGRTVSGARRTMAALAEGEGRLLLVHDDPDDPRRASFGSEPGAVSADVRAHSHSAPLVDVAIWSALRQGIAVRVIPSTGERGPDENIGLMLDAPPPAL